MAPKPPTRWEFMTTSNSFAFESPAGHSSWYGGRPQPWGYPQRALCLLPGYSHHGKNRDDSQEIPTLFLWESHEISHSFYPYKIIIFPWNPMISTFSPIKFPLFSWPKRYFLARKRAPFGQGLLGEIASAASLVIGVLQNPRTMVGEWEDPWWSKWSFRVTGWYLIIIHHHGLIVMKIAINNWIIMD